VSAAGLETGPADAYGRVTIDLEQAFRALYEGADIGTLLMAPSPEVDAFNQRLDAIDRPGARLKTPEPIAHSPEEEHARRASQWLVGQEIEDLDLRAFIGGLCDTPEQRARVAEELDLFAERGMFPLLRAMICLVAHWRERGVVWGVGRGSSVASYVLFLLGVHRIDSLRHKLDIKEFLKD
jgi:DNA polymerase III alpha subunit